MMFIRQRSILSGVLKAVLSVAFGVFLIVTKANAMTMVVQIIAGAIFFFGVLSFLIGLRFAFALPLNSIINILIAVLLFYFAGPVSAALRYVLGGLLCLFGLRQVITLFSVRAGLRGGFLLYVVPVLLILAGAMFFSEELIGNDIMGLIAGIAFILYGLSDLFALFKINQILSQKNSGKIDRVDEQHGSSAGGWGKVDNMDVKDVDYEKVD